VEAVEQRAEQAAESRVLAGDPSPRHLIPESSFLYVELESIGALEELVREVMLTVAPGQALTMPDSTQALAALTAYGADPRHVQLDQPVGVALSLPQGAREPLATFILPVQSGSAFARSIRRGSGIGPVAQQGNYVGISLDPAYSTNFEKAGAFCAGMQEGLVACRVDVGKLVTRFGPMVQMGMAGVRDQLQQQAVNEPVVGAFIEQYVAGIGSFVTSADRFDLVVARDGARFEVDMSVSMKAGSALDGFGSEDGIDLRALARYVDDEDTLAILGSLDASVMERMVRPLFEALVAVAPADVRAGVLASLADFEALAGGDGLAFATVGHLAQGGVDIATFVHGVDTDECATRFQQALNSFADETEDFVALEPLLAEQDGSRFLQLDFVPAVKSLTEDVPLAEREHALATVFGAPRMRVRMVAQDDELILSVGEGASLARKARGADAPVSPDLEHALERIGAASPAFLYRVDYRGLTTDAAGILFAELGSDPSAALQHVFERAGETPAWATVYGAVDGRQWRMGFSFELERMLASIQAYTEVRGSPSPR
jgi:hypothetical protein